MGRSWVIALVLAGCGSVKADSDAAVGSDSGGSSDSMIDTMIDAPSCGAAGDTCCANDSCGAGLSCTTSDQVCRTGQVFVGGQNSGTAVVAHGSGTSFTIDNLGTGNIIAVYGTSSTDVWALANAQVGGPQMSFLRHWNGSAWEAAITLTGFYYGLWGDAPNNYWAVNNSGGGVHFNGTTWSSPMTISGSVVFTAAWGASATDVWAVGGSTVAHYDGAWTATSRTDFSVYTRGSISGRNDQWYAGGETTAGAPAVLHRDAANFTVEPVAGCGDTRGVWAGPDDAWAISGPIIASGSCVLQPTISHREAGTWVDKGKLPNATGGQGLFGTSNRDLWIPGALSTGPALFHYDGTSWTAPYAPATGVTQFFAVWATGAD